jgi:hypothetical protein
MPAERREEMLMVLENEVVIASYGHDVLRRYLV